MTQLPVAVIGAGPVGLAAAAHLLARGLEPVVLEAGPSAGHAISQWAHVRMFSPWSFNIDAAARVLLERAGWTPPKASRAPTGAELLAQYVIPLAATPELAPRIHYDAKVVAVARATRDKLRDDGRDEPFVVRYRQGGRLHTISARVIIDASGTWSTPNPLGANGLPVEGEEDVARAIATGIPDVRGTDRPLHAGRTTLVVGSGHSAINVLLDLVSLRRTDPGTRVMWGIRRADPSRAIGGGAADALAERGALGTRLEAALAAGDIELVPSFALESLARDGEKVVVAARTAGRPIRFAVDRIVSATGFRPDIAMLREVRVGLDPALECTPALAPLIDPNLHSCGTVRPHGAAQLAHPEKNFYIAGMKSYGRAPTFLLATGHEQVRSIAAALAGDHAAAARVELNLPQTGVCSVRIAEKTEAKVAAEAAAGCCGGPAPASEDACCVADVEAKVAGKTGCGCS
ncbi:MAG: NAD(P)-binding domain-containing protein [Rhodospirillales bacterium]|nr:NAD(P)-binding domain-containing protein [Rhodospirillales bacterium]